MSPSSSNTISSRYPILLFLLTLPQLSTASSMETAKTTHAVLGSLAWVLIFPLGAIFLRVLPGPRTWIVHASIQALGIAVVTAGAGNGIYLAQKTGQLGEHHPIIGMVPFGLVWVQAIGGGVAHALFAKEGRSRVVGGVHLWVGRGLVTLGMINGGLGLLLSSDASKAAYIAYGVIAGVIWVIFVAVGITSDTRRSRGKGDAGMPERKLRGSSSDQSTEA